MRQAPRKPDFLIIGVQKSATTWLQQQLRQHPYVFMPRDELHFFDRDVNYRKGEAWYLAHFQGAGADQIIGEKTPDYIWTNCASKPDVSERKHLRIHAFRSDLKLIAVFRNPVDRFVSAFHHNQRLGRLPIDLSIGALLSDDRLQWQYREVLSGMLERGRYTTQLKAYLQVFKATQMKFLFHEDVRSSPDGVLADVQAFLGIAPQPFSDSGKARYNDYQATGLGAQIMGRTSGFSRDAAIKLDRYVLSRLPLQKVPYPTLEDADRAYLHNYYRDEMQALPDLIGRSLPTGWGV